MLSRKASIYGADRISIGNNVRIDDFAVLSGEIEIGSYVHISAGTMLFGGSTGIVLEDFTAISSRCAVYAETDDYSGEALFNPMIPDEYRKVTGGKVVFRKFSLIGTGCTVLPGVTVGTGVSVGAMSLVTKSLDEWGVYAGIPSRRIKERSRKLEELERRFLGKS